jgi:hypothetical protein
MKENDIPALVELRMELENKLENLKEYQQLKSEYESKALNLIKEAIHEKGINLESEEEASFHEVLAEHGCIACTHCITACIDCVHAV